MPHKKNPDVFELLRAKCNVIQSLPEQLTLLTNNLPSGYHRDMQLTKELVIPAIEQMKMCLHVLLEVLPSMRVNKNCIEDEKYKYIFSVEEVNRLVMKGIPFREAYHQVSESIRNNSFVPNTAVSHTHLGSIGNV
jgi:argininosuccinate lyase